jgi:uncharacterized protein GlcG (DUF336 family)
MSVTLEEAQKVLMAAVAKAKELNTRMAISVVDDHGEVIAIARMDGVQGWVVDMCKGKAMASVFWRQPSGALTERAGSPAMQGLNSIYSGKLVYAQGAVPIKRGDQVIGAVGAGGSRPEQDEEVAKAGVAALGL